MVHLIVGYGEVGRSLHKVIGRAVWEDKILGGTWIDQKVDVAHICIPYNKDFDETVRHYKFYSKLVIVHSTVPIGVCDKLGVVHSPIRGMHPNLTRGIKTFVKYFGGKNADKAARVFRELGVKTKTYKQAKTTEALKLWDTTQYGRLILLEKEIHDWCKKNKIDFNAIYTKANRDYNIGYVKLGRPDVVRPWLTHIEGPIGGHCILPNAELLKKPMQVRVLISGGWDLMHYNHVKTLQNAKKYGDYLIVNVLTDKRMRFKKGEGRPLIPLKQRMEVLRAMAVVDEVICVDNGKEYPLLKAIDKVKPDIVLINIDEQKDISEEVKHCEESNTRVIGIHRIDNGISTTKLFARFKK